MFNTTYELSLNKNYVSHWGLPEAVRELIQNAIDSESPFVYEFSPDDDLDATALTLTSEFTILSPQTLLLGSTSKADSESSIGSFGEGYKISLLVLTRLGKRVCIANGDKAWEPKFKYNSKFGEELLVVQESPLPYKNKGLSFKVHGLTDSEVADVVSSCLQMQDHIGAIKRTSLGDIMLEKKGKLFVGGLYICETELEYGYNIKPANIRLERDRQTVSHWDLKQITKEMWFETEDFDRIASLIEKETPDVEYAKYNSPELVKEACFRLFRERHPGAVVAENQTQLRALVERGMERVVVLGGTWYATVSQSKSYLSETCLATESIEQRMQRWLRKNRGEMRTGPVVAFKELIGESKSWTHK